MARLHTIGLAEHAAECPKCHLTPIPLRWCDTKYTGVLYHNGAGGCVTGYNAVDMDLVVNGRTPEIAKDWKRRYERAGYAPDPERPHMWRCPIKLAAGVRAALLQNRNTVIARILTAYEIYTNWISYAYGAALPVRLENALPARLRTRALYVLSTEMPNSRQLALRIHEHYKRALTLDALQQAAAHPTAGTAKAEKFETQYKKHTRRSEGSVVRRNGYAHIQLLDRSIDLLGFGEPVASGESATADPYSIKTQDFAVGIDEHTMTADSAAARLHKRRMAKDAHLRMALECVAVSKGYKERRSGT